jgi:hypothetical protein
LPRITLGSFAREHRYAQDDRFCGGGKWPGPTPVENA